MNANRVVPNPNPQMKRIRTMSQIIKALFLIYVFVAGLVAAPSSGWILGLSSSELKGIPAGAKLLYALGMGVFLLAVITFYRLLNLYEQGTVFCLANVRLYKRLGCLAMSYGLLDACGPEFTMSPVRHLKFFLLEAISSPWIIGGLFVVLISLIMREACKLREEQELTV